MKIDLMITVYYTGFEAPLHRNTFSAYMDSLPVEIKNVLIKYKRWQDAHASLFGKLLLQQRLMDLSINFGLSGLKHTDFGRPYLENFPDFNISHSGQYVVCAFTENGKIGIDIEQIKPICLDLFDKIFNEEEWQLIKGSKDQYRIFFYYWSVKESIIKADGRGINVPLKNIHIKDGIATLDGRNWYLKSIPLFDDYVVQIACSEMITEVCIDKIDFKDQ